MVSNTSADYNKHKKTWRHNRDAFEGQEKIKAGGTEYLPAKGYHIEAGMESGKPGYAEYTTFAHRAVWFDATHRTVEAMMGLIFRRPAFISGLDGGPHLEKGLDDPELLPITRPESIDKKYPYKKDFTIDGKSLSTASEWLCQETILQGRSGVLVSYPNVDTSNMSQQEVEDLGIHAYSALYTTEDIINWKIEKRNGKQVPVLVVLKERIDAPWNPLFETQQIDQYRVLQLDDEGYYKQSVYYLETPIEDLPKDPFAKAYKEGEYYPMMNGEKLTFIPFYPISVSGVSWDIERSPVEGIVNLNIAHYRNSAELEAGIAITASPTLVLSGYEPDKGATLVLGGNNAITMPNTDSKAEYLEYQGSGLSTIKEAMSDKKKEMAVLGLRILSSEQAVNEGSETATIHSKGEESVLANIANSVSEALTKALQLMIKWDNPEDKVENVKIKLNTDFIPNSVSANTINSITVLWKSFGLSDQELFDVLQRGEIIPADKTFREHMREIKTSTAYTLFNESGEEDETSDDNVDFTAPVDVNRLTKPESPGVANSPKRPDVDPGGSSEE